MTDLVIARNTKTRLENGKSLCRTGLQINGWGQDSSHVFGCWITPAVTSTKFQLKRGRSHIFPGLLSILILPTSFSWMDEAASGETVRCWTISPLASGIDNSDLARAVGCEPASTRCPSPMARWMSGKEFEFADRSMLARSLMSTRSFAWGKINGQTVPASSRCIGKAASSTDK